MTRRDDDAPFTLARQSAKGKKRETFETEPTRQGVLFAGADCLAGQGELWNPDGRDGKCQE